MLEYKSDNITARFQSREHYGTIWIHNEGKSECLTFTSYITYCEALMDLISKYEGEVK